MDTFTLGLILFFAPGLMVSGMALADAFFGRR